MNDTLLLKIARRFARLPRWARAAMKTLGSVAFWALVWHEHVRARAPNEPQQAILVTLALFAATLVLNEYFGPKPKIENARPAGLGDFDFPTATEGRVIPLVFGRNKISGPNVVWYDDLSHDAITKRVKTGLWSGTRQVIGYRYRIGMQLGLARGPGMVLKKVFIGDVEVFSGTVSTNTSFDVDKPDLFGVDDGVQATCDFFVGSTTQPVSPYLALFQNVSGATPRYTGTSYLVVRELGVAAASARGAQLGNSTTIRPWAFEVERFPGLFSGQSAGNNVIGGADCNPVNVLYELITNTEWGMGFPAADVDTANFKAAADVMITEGNGFSMVVDREMRREEFKHELERQIDGVCFLDHQTGKWRIKLARADYSIGSVPQLTDDNVKEIRSFDRGAWEDTVNQISVQYDKRDDAYKKSFALAQDMANSLIRGGGTVGTVQVVSAEKKYPGVKSSALAANIAWRDLRVHSYPLARAEVTLNREFWDLRQGDVVALTSTALGVTQLPMRVTRIVHGRLEDNQITAQLVQDVFRFAVASYGTPGATNWSLPTVGLVAYPSTQQKAFEAPRGIVVRDPDYAGDSTVSKIFASARRQGGEVTYEIRQRNAAGATSGSYFFAGDAASFVRIGKLQSNLATGTAIPTATITIVPDPDAQATLEGLFDDSTGLTDMGVDLKQLILVGDEFMLVKSAAINGSNVDLQNVYRGVLDTAQMEHLANAPVWLVFAGAALSDTNVPNTNNVDVELRMRSAASTFAGAVTTISFTMAKRTWRPYPAACYLYNGSGTPFGTPSLEGAGGPGLNDFRIDVAWRRRDFRATDEVTALLSDSATVDASSEYQLEVRADPDGTNVLVGSVSAWTTGAGPLQVSRLDVISAAAAGTELRFRLRARHDLHETDITSRHDLVHDVTPSSSLVGQFYLGKKGTNVATNAYTAAATGTFSVDVGAAYATGAVEVQINSGGWSTVIAATNTTGTFAATSGDLIELRHTVAESPSPNFVRIKNPSSTPVAYGVFVS